MRYNKFMKRPRTNLFRLLLLPAALLALTACNHSNGDSIVGNWMVTFSGAYTGTAVMSINSDGAFDFNINLTPSGRAATSYRVQGVVGTFSGTIVGKIFLNQTTEAGQFSGIMRSSSACDGSWSIGSGPGFPQGPWTGQK